MHFISTGFLALILLQLVNLLGECLNWRSRELMRSMPWLLLMYVNCFPSQNASLNYDVSFYVAIEKFNVYCCVRPSIELKEKPESRPTLGWSKSQSFRERDCLQTPTQVLSRRFKQKKESLSRTGSSIPSRAKLWNDLKRREMQCWWTEGDPFLGYDVATPFQC